MDLDKALEVKAVNQWFGPKRVLHDVNLTLLRGEIVALVGPSGCGKTTLLQAILQINKDLPKTGTIAVWEANEHLRQHVVTSPGKDRGIVFQQYSLYPFKTALDNVVLGPKLANTTIPFRIFRPIAWWRLRRQYRAEAERLLAKLGLADAMHRFPDELSGGMRQRVAIAQALIMKPQILLLDEPFGALDEAVREEMRTMLLELYQENLEAKKAGQRPPYTILIVTHEIDEAIYVADRVIGLSQYWDWQKHHRTCPGATVVYDKVMPVFAPGDEFNPDALKSIRKEIRSVISESETPSDPKEHQTFWDEIQKGKGEGVLAS